MQTDTIKLLRECNAGIKMGESAIKKVLPHAQSEELRHTLEVCKNTHAALGDETHAMLLEHHADTKEPHAIARMMSDVKIYAKMLAKESDSQIADVMTDGCDMGIKSLSLSQPIQEREPRSQVNRPSPHHLRGISREQERKV